MFKILTNSLILLAFASPIAFAQQTTGTQTGSGAVTGDVKTGTTDTTNANASVGDETADPAKSTKKKRKAMKMKTDKSKDAAADEHEGH